MGKLTRHILGYYPCEAVMPTPTPRKAAPVLEPEAVRIRRAWEVTIGSDTPLDPVAERLSIIFLWPRHYRVTVLRSHNGFTRYLTHGASWWVEVSNDPPWVIFRGARGEVFGVEA